MKAKISKTQASEEIKEFFNHVKNKTPEQVKKMKRLAMSHNIKLGDKRKLFCKKCFIPYKHPGISIKNGYVNIICESCDHKSRWKFKGRIKTGVKIEVEECC